MLSSEISSTTIPFLPTISSIFDFEIECFSALVVNGLTANNKAIETDKKAMSSTHQGIFGMAERINETNAPEANQIDTNSLVQASTIKATTNNANHINIMYSSIIMLL